MGLPIQELRELLDLDADTTVAEVVAKVRELLVARDASAQSSGAHARDPAH